MNWSKRVKEVLSAGRSLDAHGVNNWALSKTQALKALDQFKQLKIPVSGGDIYEIVNNAPRITYDNWFYDRKKNESDDDYLSLSIKKAQEYINIYEPLGRNDFLVVLIPNDGECA